MTRNERILELIEWCIKIGINPDTPTWIVRVSNLAATFSLSKRTVKDYIQTMAKSYHHNKWLNFIQSSEKLTTIQKEEWVKKVGILKTLPRHHATLPEPYPTCTPSKTNQKITNLKATLFDYWNAFPNASIKDTAKFFDISYVKRKKVLWKYHSLWRTRYGFGKVPKNLKKNNQAIHRGKWETWVPPSVNRKNVKKLGWNLSSNRNKMLWFDGEFGSIFWHYNGHVILMLHLGFVKKGCAKQLFCKGFNRLLSDDVLASCLTKINHVGGHFTMQTDRRMPNMQISNFKKSHGINIKLGDRSHPNSVEIEYSVPEFLEPIKKMFDYLVKDSISSISKTKTKNREDKHYII